MQALLTLLLCANIARSHTPLLRRRTLCVWLCLCACGVSVCVRSCLPVCLPACCVYVCVRVCVPRRNKISNTNLCKKKGERSA